MDRSEESGYSGSPLSSSLSTITVLSSTPIGDFVPTIQLVLGPSRQSLKQNVEDNTKTNQRRCNGAPSILLLYRKPALQNRKPGDQESPLIKDYCLSLSLPFPWSFSFSLSLSFFLSLFLPFSLSLWIMTSPGLGASLCVRLIRFSKSPSTEPVNSINAVGDRSNGKN